MSLTDLPVIVFLEIVAYLPLRDLIRARRVCKDFLEALNRQDVCTSLILIRFPLSREGRILRKYFKNKQTEKLNSSDWAAVLVRLVTRYYHLGIATPRLKVKFPLLKDSWLLRGVTPWNRFLKLDDRTSPFHFWDPVWTCDATAGIVVYPRGNETYAGYYAIDLSTGIEVAVPFEMMDKIIRRVRLSHGILIFEWCERQAYSSIDSCEIAHRHFATAFDVTREAVEDELASLEKKMGYTGNVWNITLRSEWMIHYFGLPLSHQDRFFSVHNSTHYVVYIWQPTRSPWGEDQPLERLTVWELGKPTGFEAYVAPIGQPESAKRYSPRIIMEIANDELDHFDIRQGALPSLRGLELDACTWDRHTDSTAGHVYFLQDEHIWAAGPHSRLHVRGTHRVASCGVPLTGEGPGWLDKCLDPMKTSHAPTPCRHPKQENPADEAPVLSRWPGSAPCWRHADFPFLTISEVHDLSAGIRICARQCFIYAPLNFLSEPRLTIQGIDSVPPGPVVPLAHPAPDDVAHRLAQFQVVDFGDDDEADPTQPAAAPATAPATVPTVAPAPTLPTTQAEIDTLTGSGGSLIFLHRNGTRASVMEAIPSFMNSPFGGGGHSYTSTDTEIVFDGSIWYDLMHVGHIVGDERWVVGQDIMGNLTILYF